MGVIVPKSGGGSSVAPVVALPKRQALQTGLGPAVQGFEIGTQLVSDVGNQIRRQEDESRVTDALTLAERRWQNDLYSPEGLLSRKGVNALEGPDRKSVIDDGLGRRVDILDEAMGTLTTPRQKTALKDAWAARDRFAVDTLQRHMERERGVYSDSVDEAFIAQRQQSLSVAGDDIHRSVIIAEIASKADDLARRKGLSSEATDVMIRKFVGPPLESAIANLARTDPAAAQKLFEERKDYIDADRHAAITGRLETESILSQSQALVEQVYAESPGASMPERERMIRARSDGKLEDDAISRMRSRMSMERSERIYNQGIASDNLGVQIGRYFAAKPGDRGGVTVDQLRDSVTRQALDAGLDPQSLHATIDAYTKPGGPRTDPNVWSNAWTIISGGNRTQIQAMSDRLPYWRPHLTPADYSEIRTETDRILKGNGDEASSSGSPSGVGAIEIGQKIGRDAGLTTEQLNLLSLRTHEAIVAQTPPGKKLTWTEQDKIARDELVRLTATDSGRAFFDAEKRIFEFTAADRKATLDDLPDEWIQLAARPENLGPEKAKDLEAVREWAAKRMDDFGVPRE